MASLDKTGLTYLWSKLKVKLNNKSDVGHTHSVGEISELHDCATSGNADTVDGYHIRVVTDENDTGQTGYITFIV